MDVNSLSSAVKVYRSRSCMVSLKGLKILKLNNIIP